MGSFINPIWTKDQEFLKSWQRRATCRAFNRATSVSGDSSLPPSSNWKSPPNKLSTWVCPQVTPNRAPPPGLPLLSPRLRSPLLSFLKVRTRASTLILSSLWRASSRSRWTRSTSLTEDRGCRAVAERSTSVESVESTLPPAPTCLDTSKPTASYPRRQRRRATSARSSTWACRPWPCTCSPTTSPTPATSAARASLDPGCSTDTREVTRGRSPSDALTVERSLQTGQTSELTCRRIQVTKPFSATIAIKRSM